MKSISYLPKTKVSLNFDNPKIFREQLYNKKIYSKVKPFIKALPEKEQELLHLHFELGKDQKEIAGVMDLTQGGVSHRISRARQRLKYLINTPKLTRKEFYNNIQPVLKDNKETRILWEVYNTSCQSTVAKRMKITQSKVRNHALRSLKKLRKHSKCKEYVEALEHLFENNFNILKEIKLPKWEHKNKDKSRGANMDMVKKLLADIHKEDTVLITEGAHRNMYARVVKLFKKDKMADLEVSVGFFKTTLSKVPFTWFSKQKDEIVEAALYFLKRRRVVTASQLEKFLNTVPKEYRRCVKYLKVNAIVTEKQGRKYTRYEYNF
jgi:hypothetical protein